MGISYLQVKRHRNAGTSKDVYENVPSSTRIMFKHPETQMPTSSRRGKETEVCSQDGTPDSQEEGTYRSHDSEGGAPQGGKGRKRPENEKDGPHAFWFRSQKDQRQATLCGAEVRPVARKGTRGHLGLILFCFLFRVLTTWVCSLSGI